MAKKKNKAHQRRPLIERINAKKIVEEHLKDDAVQHAEGRNGGHPAKSGLYNWRG